YLRIVGPSYGFFGLALALYFASQGAGRLFWPLSAGFLRMLVAIAGGWLALRLTGSLHWLFAALALGLVLHGLTLVLAIRTGAGFRQPAGAVSLVGGLIAPGAGAAMFGAGARLNLHLMAYRGERAP